MSHNNNKPKGAKLVQVSQVDTPTETEIVSIAVNQVHQSENLIKIDRTKFKEAMFIEGKLYWRNPETDELLPSVHSQIFAKTEKP